MKRTTSWTRTYIEPDEQEQFQKTAESELLGLHEGNFAGCQISRLNSRHAGMLGIVSVSAD